MEFGSIDLKKLLCVSPASESKEKSDRVSYTKDHLIILSKNAPCQTRPDCLSANCLGLDGLWDPEKWHQSFDTSPIEEGRRQINLEELRAQSNVVLGPQRRSFQGGCHVATKEKLGATFTRPGISGSKLSERGIKLSRQQSQEAEQHPPHLKRFHSMQNDTSDWKKDIDNKRTFEKSEPFRKPRHPDYKKYSAPMHSSSNRRYNDDRNYRDSRQAYYEESEPEWISYGPKSQFDTIELTGFEDADDFSWMGGEIPMDDVPDRKKKSGKKSSDEKVSSTSKPHESGALEDEELEPKPLEECKPLEESKVEDTLKEQAVKNDKNPLAEEKVTKEVEEAPIDKEASKPEAADSNQGSRFSQWFSNEPNSTKDEVLTPEQRLVDEVTSENYDSDTVDQAKPVLQQLEKLDFAKSDPVVKQPVQPTPSSGTSDLHGTDAFNRLIASIRATDNKVKEQMQQRNQKIQALQTMMKATKTRNNLNVTSIENATDPAAKANFQTQMLKQQLEKQKDAYHQKLRQIEQQRQKSSPTMFSGQDVLQLAQQQAMMPGYSGQNQKGQIQNVMDERAAATASLAAKLAGKTKKDEANASLVDRMYGSAVQQTELSANVFNEQALLEKESLLKLKRMHSAPAESTKSKNFPIANAQNNTLKNNSLLIAQMLAKAGVTEDQLKQLTIEQQELVISMVQNQYTQKDIGKFVNFDNRNNIKFTDSSSSQANAHSAASSTLSNMTFGNSNGSKDFYTNKSLPTRDMRQTNAASTSSTTNPLSFLTDKSTALSVYNENASSSYPQTPNMVQVSTAQSRILSHNVMPIHPTIMSPVVPLMSPNIAPHMLTPAMAPPHLTHLVQTPTPLAPPHPALLLQMQQQLYATQVAAAQQQQQQAVLAALQKQQQIAVAHAQSNDAAKLQQSIQNMRLAASSSRPATVDPAAQDRAQFNNPLSQWFSRDVLRQSQFPPVSQLTGQQPIKMSGNQHSVESALHSTKH